MIGYSKVSLAVKILFSMSKKRSSNKGEASADNDTSIGSLIFMNKSPKKASKIPTDHQAVRLKSYFLPYLSLSFSLPVTLRRY